MGTKKELQDDGEYYECPKTLVEKHGQWIESFSEKSTSNRKPNVFIETGEPDFVKCYLNNYKEYNVSSFKKICAENAKTIQATVLRNLTVSRWGEAIEYLEETQ